MTELCVTFLDVGQGDATVVVLPDGDGVLIDCPRGSASTIVDYLESANVASLGLVVITHSDLDHAGGIIDVIRAFSGPTQTIAMLLDRPLQNDTQTDKKYRVMLQELAELLCEDIKPQEPYAGHEMRFGEVVIATLHPNYPDRLRALAQNNRNDLSIVLGLHYKGTRILLCGDVQRQGWQWMMDRDTSLKADVFKFPHHGAWYDGEPTLEQVLNLVDPSLVVISVGSTNGYGHPSLDTLNLLRGTLTNGRFVCTQATSRCHSELEATAIHVRDLLPDESRGGHSFKNTRSCPCAGNVTVRVSGDGVTVSPTREEHTPVIDLFARPQCR